MNIRIIAGVGFLILAAAGIVLFQALQPEPEPEPEPVTVVRGYYGGEKTAFLENPEVQRILRERYNIEVDFIRRGSIEMVSYPPSEYENIDFIWPSNEVAVALYEETYGSVSNETIFRSPIVLYSWQPVVDALIALEIVEQRDATFYVVDMNQLVELILSGTTWEEIGVPELGDTTVKVISTDPTLSNSGNMFYGLLANLLSRAETGNEIATDDSLQVVLPTIEDYYVRQGQMLDSSGDLFNRYVTTGIGENPLIAGYENQLIEFYLANEDLRQRIEDESVILYPEPTVWSSHPMIALTDNGEALIVALQDEDLQTIAWQQHGFRSEIPTINDPETLGFDQGVPQTITRVLNLPRPSVMQTMIDALAPLG